MGETVIHIKLKMQVRKMLVNGLLIQSISGRIKFRINEYSSVFRITSRTLYVKKED